MMKKIVLALLLLVVSFGASAKFRWGPTVGVNFSDMYWKQELVSTGMLTGFSAGLAGELMIPGIGFGIDMGIKYVNHGGKVNFGEQYIWSSDGIGNTDLRMHVLQIPLNLKFKWTRMNGIENYFAPFVFVGPQFNFNLATSKCDAVEKAGASVGIDVGLGFELWKKFQLSGGYVWDVTYDVKTVKLDNFSAKVQGWFVDFTYLF